MKQINNQTSRIARRKMPNAEIDTTSALLAHCADIKGQRVGSFRNAATYNFYPTKNLEALSDGELTT